MAKILVVDDVESELSLISQVLKQAGFQVVQASDGDEAIGLIQETSPDLVILDVIMPRMNGFEVIRELRDHPETETLPVIFCSQKDTEIDKTWGMGLGADAYVTKPFEPNQLVEIVKRLL